MHAEARAGMERMIAESGIELHRDMTALDLGGVDINGTTRDLFPRAKWTGLDIEAGPGVDIVADATTWRTRTKYDVVTCTELLEHVKDWPACVDTAWRALRKGGYLFITAASTGRWPHGARGGPAPEPGEHYANVPFEELFAELQSHTANDFHVRYQVVPGDVYAWLRK